MTTNNRSLSRFFSSFTGLNKSSEKYYKQAWKKIGWATLGISLSVLYISLAVPDPVWKVSGLVAMAYLFSKFVGRFIVSWNGWNLRTAKFGFFECDATRRMNPLRKKSEYNFGAKVICKESAPELIPYYEKLRAIEAGIEKASEGFKKLVESEKSPVPIPKREVPEIRPWGEKPLRPFLLPSTKRIENIVHLPEIRASELVRESA